jgi:hypothetical protein
MESAGSETTRGIGEYGVKMGLSDLPDISLAETRTRA